MQEGNFIGCRYLLFERTERWQNQFIVTYPSFYSSRTRTRFQKCGQSFHGIDRELAFVHVCMRSARLLTALTRSDYTGHRMMTCVMNPPIQIAHTYSYKPRLLTSLFVPSNLRYYSGCCVSGYVNIRLLGNYILRFSAVEHTAATVHFLGSLSPVKVKRWSIRRRTVYHLASSKNN